MGPTFPGKIFGRGFLLAVMKSRRFNTRVFACNTNSRDVLTRASTAVPRRKKPQLTTLRRNRLPGIVGIRTQRQKSLTEDKASGLQDAGDRLPARAQT